MIEYGKGVAQAAGKAPMAPQLLKKACSSSGHQRAQLGVQRCRNYGGTRHNT
jgi:hypothetical protein